MYHFIYFTHIYIFLGSLAENYVEIYSNPKLKERKYKSDNSKSRILMRFRM